ncbi:MAG: four helix bundle protein [Bacteroidota bacterium]
MTGSFRDLTVYKKAFVLAMEIFEITKRYISEEKFELQTAICQLPTSGKRHITFNLTLNI